MPNTNKGTHQHAGQKLPTTLVSPFSVNVLNECLDIKKAFPNKEDFN